MGAFEALADPVRRRIVELLAVENSPPGRWARQCSRNSASHSRAPPSISEYSVTMTSCRYGPRVLAGSTR